MKWVDKQPQFGDIIRTKVTFYYHCGIFVSSDEVIQFGAPDNISQPAESVRVLITDIYAFMRDGDIEVGEAERCEFATLRKPKECVEIARSRLGEGGYDLLHNNCEHFVFECALGEKKSAFLNDIRTKLRKKLGK